MGSANRTEKHGQAARPTGSRDPAPAPNLEQPLVAERPEGNRDEPVRLYEQAASEIRRAIADVSLTRKMVLEIVASS